MRLTFSLRQRPVIASNAFSVAPSGLMPHLDLHTLLLTLSKAKTAQETLLALKSFPRVQSFYSTFADIGKKINALGEKKRLICLKIIAIGQEKVLKSLDFDKEKAQEQTLFKDLEELEAFYKPIGGIVGYQSLALDLIHASEKHPAPLELMQPQGFDIREEKEGLLFAFEGLKDLDSLAMLYPVGGAGDRFGLIDEKSKEPLPLARLIFLGKTLLEHLILDVIAKEYLYFKCFNKSTLVPMGLMTSDEKENHKHIEQMLRDKHYFGRSKELFHLFKQPRVPLFDPEGQWLFDKAGLMLKPGGHGMIWQLAQDKGFFRALKKQDKKHLLVRQINNPASSVDYGLLAFIGVGAKGKKHFGFCSCPRSIGSKEGMDVVKVTRDESGKSLGSKSNQKSAPFTYTLTNIEYTEFEKCGLKDIEENPNSGVSAFPSNTNILFAQIEALGKVLEKGAFPGPILNFKEGKSARIELMMQNIADFLGQSFDQELKLDHLNSLSTFLTYGERKKTISVTKNKWKPGEKLDETPAGALFDHLGLMKALLERCQVITPELEKEDYLKNGLSFFFSYHPALGPLFSIIAQKIRKGSLAKNSYLKLDIAEVDIENLSLNGALIIQAKKPTGFDGKKYSSLSGKCILKNVSVQNKGHKKKTPFLAATASTIEGEALEIEIEGFGEFIAEDVTFTKPEKIIVPSGTQVRAVQEGDQVKLKKTSIKKPTWSWKYHHTQEAISLEKELFS